SGDIRTTQTRVVPSIPSTNQETRIWLSTWDFRLRLPSKKPTPLHPSISFLVYGTG
ncbi:hypothetical protein M9458_041223, partial [Cirrhinus mrigala]